MKKEIKGAKFVYYSLITTFIALYLCVAFVSTLHAITFFQLANSLTLAIFLGAAFEIGQASVLFSILMTKNKHRSLAWSMMFLLTTLQISANVFASFKFMDQSGTTDWTYWQRSILFWLEADSPEIYKVTIAWITGALLPIVALGMTALAADNLKLTHENVDLDYDQYNEEEEIDEEYDTTVYVGDKDSYEAPVKEVKEELEKKPEFQFDKDFWIGTPSVGKAEVDPLKGGYIAPFVESKAKGFDEIQNSLIQYPSLDEALSDAKKEKEDYKDQEVEDINKFVETIEDDEEDIHTISEGNIATPVDPVNKPKGWHLKSMFVDDAGNVFHRGKYKYTDSSRSKKA